MKGEKKETEKKREREVKILSLEFVNFYIVDGNKSKGSLPQLRKLHIKQLFPSSEAFVCLKKNV